VAFYCPFTGNGDPYVRDVQGNILKDGNGRLRTHWPPEYLLNEEEPFYQLGEALRQ
jgi:hypothetical protein